MKKITTQWNLIPLFILNLLWILAFSAHSQTLRPQPLTPHIEQSVSITPLSHSTVNSKLLVWSNAFNVDGQSERQSYSSLFLIDYSNEATVTPLLVSNDNQLIRQRSTQGIMFNQDETEYVFFISEENLVASAQGSGRKLYKLDTSNFAISWMRPTNDDTYPSRLFRASAVNKVILDSGSDIFSFDVETEQWTKLLEDGDCRYHLNDAADNGNLLVYKSCARGQIPVGHFIYQYEDQSLEEIIPYEDGSFDVKLSGNGQHLVFLQDAILHRFSNTEEEWTLTKTPIDSTVHGVPFDGLFELNHSGDEVSFVAPLLINTSELETAKKGLFNYDFNSGTSVLLSTFEPDSAWSDNLVTTSVSDLFVPGVPNKPTFFLMSLSDYYTPARQLFSIDESLIREQSNEFGNSTISLDATSTLPFQTDLSISGEDNSHSPDFLYQIQRTQIETDSDYYFYSSDASVTDFRLGLTPGQYRYQVKRCNQHFICGAVSDRQTVEVSDFSAPFNLTSAYDPDGNQTVYQWDDLSNGRNVSYQLRRNQKVYFSQENRQTIRNPLSGINHHDIRVCIENYVIQGDKNSRSCSEHYEQLTLETSPNLSLIAKVMGDYSGIRLSWSENESYTYNIHRIPLDIFTYEYELVARDVSSGWVDTDVVPGAQHYYAIEVCTKTCSQSFQENVRGYASTFFVRSSGRLSLGYSRGNADSHLANAINLDLSEYSFDLHLEDHQLFRRNVDEDTDFEPIANFSPQMETYSDTDILPQNRYEYYYQGCFGENCHRSNIFEATSPAFISPELNFPIIEVDTQSYRKAAIFDWEAVEGAAGYLVNINQVSEKSLTIELDGDETQYAFDLGLLSYFEAHGLFQVKVASLYPEGSGDRSLHSQWSNTIEYQPDEHYENEVIYPLVVEISKEGLYLPPVISWRNSSEHQFVKVYRKTGEETSFTEIDVLDIHEARQFSGSFTTGSYTDSDVFEAGTVLSYKLKVCALNQMTCSNFSNTVSIGYFSAESFPVPGEISNVQISDGSYLAFDLVNNSNIGISRVEIGYKEESETDFRLFGSTRTGSSTYSREIYSLVPEQNYVFALRNCIDSACGNWGTVYTYTHNVAGILKPGKPYLRLDNYHDSNISLHSFYHNQTSRPVDTVTLYTLDDSGESILQTHIVTEIDGTDFSFNLTQYNYDEILRFFTRACNVSVCTDSEVVRTFIKQPADESQIPQIPSNLVASQGEFLDKIEVDWSDSENATFYRVTRSDSSEPGREFNVYDSFESFGVNETDETIIFTVKACNSNHCSDAARVTGSTFLTDIANFTISGDSLLTFASEAQWQGSGVALESAGGELDTIRGFFTNNTWLDTNKNFTARANIYISNYWLCGVLYSHDYSLPGNNNRLYIEEAMSVFYTGEYCENDENLTPNSLYLKSVYLNEPILIENKDALVNRWIEVSLSVNDGNAILTIDGTEYQGDQTLSSDLFRFTKQNWRVGSQGSQTNLRSLDFSTEGPASLIKRSQYRLSAVTRHPTYASVGLYNFDDDREISVQAYIGEYNNLSNKQTQYVAENELTRSFHFNGLTPRVDNWFFARLCDADLCSPFTTFQLKPFDYLDLTAYTDTFSLSYGDVPGELHLEIEHGGCCNYFFDSVRIERQGENEAAARQVLDAPVTEFFANSRNNYQSKTWIDTGLVPGEFYQYRVILCNPLGCSDEASFKGLEAPVDSDGDGVMDHLDAFPDDPNESRDTDGDGIGDNSDPDIDNDGIDNNVEESLGLDPFTQDAFNDSDYDSYINAMEIAVNTDAFDGTKTPEEHYRIYSFEGLFSISEVSDEFTLENFDEIDSWPNKFNGVRALEARDYGHNTVKKLTLEQTTGEGKLWFAFSFTDDGDFELQASINEQIMNWQQYSTVYRNNNIEWYFVGLPVATGVNTLELSFSFTNNVLYLDAFLLPNVAPPRKAVQGDFNGDGKTDLSFRAPSLLMNYLKYKDNEEIGRISFGKQSHYIPLSGDFDGDGAADIVMRDPQTFTWFIRKSSDNTIIREVFGKNSEDVPVLADYDGDGITDLAVRRASNFTWYIKRSSDGTIMRKVFGRHADDIPVPADYDGDGKADIAVRRPGNRTWYILNSNKQDLLTDHEDGITRLKFGLQESDIPVVADYDNDGRADIAVRRPENFTWYVYQSSDSQIQRTVFGRHVNDIPVVGDYDGDGRPDIAVRRPGTYYWYILHSSDNSIGRHVFGRNAKYIPFLAPISQKLDMLHMHQGKTDALEGTETSDRIFEYFDGWHWELNETSLH